MFTAPCAANYKLEVWGAEGSAYQSGVGGLGGYATGVANILESITVSIVIGGQGKESEQFPRLTTNTGGYNGGGHGQEGGGGATHIAQNNRGILQNYVNNKAEVYIVAGGGGGGDGGDYGGSGGGETGGDGIDIPNYYNTKGFGTGGTQTAGGTGGNTGIFGRGADSWSDGKDAGGGGGGGWYGGGSSQNNSSPGGGGSGYIGGVANGFMQNGVQSGNGKAVISWHPAI